jgi:hypothetical protein
LSAATRPTPTLFERLLQEAHGHSLIAAALAEEPPVSAANIKEIAARQQQFYACVRQAEYALAIAKSLPHDFDTAGALERLSDLKRHNVALAKERRDDEQHAIANMTKKIVWTVADAPPLGTPMWLYPVSSSVNLRDEAEKLTSERGTRSELILLGAVFLLVLSYFRHTFLLARRFAPEIGIGICAGVMLTFGVGVISVALIGMMLLVRLWQVASRLRSVLTTQAAPNPPSAPPPAT